MTIFNPAREIEEISKYIQALKNAYIRIDGSETCPLTATAKNKLLNAAYDAMNKERKRLIKNAANRLALRVTKLKAGE